MCGCGDGRGATTTQASLTPLLPYQVDIWSTGARLPARRVAQRHRIEVSIGALCTFVTSKPKPLNPHPNNHSEIVPGDPKDTPWAREGLALSISLIIPTIPSSGWATLSSFNTLS